MPRRAPRGLHGPGVPLRVPPDRGGRLIGAAAMMGIIRELLCLFSGGHFVRRTPRILNAKDGGRPTWATRLRCRCGTVDYTVPGLVNHPEDRP